MKNFLICLCLCIHASIACASPVSFDMQFWSSTAYAETGGGSDGPYANSDGQPLTVPLSASIVASNALASAGAASDAGFLAASADTRGMHTYAFGAATFGGTFSSSDGGHYTLSLNFDTFSDMLGGTAEGSFFYSLIANGVTLFSDSFSQSTQLLHEFDLDPGTLANLDLSLTSNASAFDGNGFNISSLNFSLDTADSAVPEPQTLLLVLFACGAMIYCAPRTKRRNPYGY